MSRLSRCFVCCSEIKDGGAVGYEAGGSRVRHAACVQPARNTRPTASGYRDGRFVGSVAGNVVGGVVYAYTAADTARLAALGRTELKALAAAASGASLEILRDAWKLAR